VHPLLDLADVKMRPISDARDPGSGLYSRSSMFFKNASRSTWASAPTLLKSSSRIRTRTPRAAAARRRSSNCSVLLSAWMA
jgi:hypothetical protein